MVLDGLKGNERDIHFSESRVNRTGTYVKEVDIDRKVVDIAIKMIDVDVKVVRIGKNVVDVALT